MDFSDNDTLPNPDPSSITFSIFMDLFKDPIPDFYEIPDEGSDASKPMVLYPDDFPPMIQRPCICDGYRTADPPGGTDIIDSSFEEPDEPLVLAIYTPMSSPARITFLKQNIRLYTGHLIRKYEASGLSLRFDTAMFCIFFAVKDIMNHEIFHYYCDHRRYLTQSRFDRDKEEAYAVAHSYMQMDRWHTFYHAFQGNYIGKTYFKDYFHGPQKERNIQRMEQAFDFLIEEHYRAFTMPGYRDWHMYKDMSHYQSTFFEYLKDGHLDRLLANGVPVNDLSWEIRHYDKKGAIVEMI